VFSDRTKIYIGWRFAGVKVCMVTKLLAGFTGLRKGGEDKGKGRES